MVSPIFLLDQDHGVLKYKFHSTTIRKTQGKEMDTNILVKDIEKYEGKYVATKTFLDKDVICSGDDPVKVYNEAQNKGSDDPVIFYVPKRDVVHIYSCL
ncbi:MAG: hypothetical protein A3D21_00280 [Nitrospirae bacterium RIFCSPHIGHO2_02_FULL_42_12]|nr:MAG: hypothetical protein A3D21_00280 [Nitrospirae bacterium RIFCSPHIGHO2_02_FULL_42_12]